MMNQIEIKTLCLVRKPPGDRWAEPDGSEIFPTLTSGIEYIFQKTGTKEFRISAGDGKIFSISFEHQEPEKPKAYSIYGEEY